MTSQIATNLANLVYTDISSNGDVLVNTTEADLALSIDAYISGLTANATTLSANKPDFEQILVQFQQSLEASDNTWIDILTSGTGQAILRFFASVGTFVALAQERGAQETMLQSAQLTSSIYAITKMLGVRINRKTPSQVSVNLNCSSATLVEIPAYTQFSIAGGNWFNRVPIVFSVGGTQPLAVTLYQGQILTNSYTASGAAYSIIEIGQEDYTVSDTDIVVTDTTIGQIFTRVTDGLYHYTLNDYVFNDNSTPQGNAQIQFGDGVYGYAPNTGDSLTVTYARTLGIQGNGLSTGQAVSCSGFSTVSGITTSASSGGIDQLDKEFYRTNAPYMYSKNNRNVTRRDYETAALQYTGNIIYDVLVQGQQELGANSPAYLNTIQVTTIPNVPWTTQSWNAFASYLTNAGIYQMTILQGAINSVTLNIEADIYAFSDVDLPSLQANITANVQSELTPGRYSIDKSIYLSDITKYLFGPSNISVNIDYIDIISPAPNGANNGDTILVAPTYPNPHQYIVLGTLTLNMFYSERSYPNRLV